MRALWDPFWLIAALQFGACSDPAFVSLGRNVQSVERSGAAEAEPCSEARASEAESFVAGCEGPVEPDRCELAAPSWAVESACSDRRETECPNVYSSDRERLSGLLSDLLSKCTEFEYSLSVTFAAGCATAFSLDRVDVAGIEALRACVAARLASEHYLCADTLECGLGRSSHILTK